MKQKYDFEIYFNDCLSDSISTIENIKKYSEIIKLISEKIADTLNSGRKLMLCGNGGSAADCQHLSAEFTGRFIKDRKPLAAITLTTDTSAITSIANDYSFKEIFSRQIEAIGIRGDCLIVISSSGNSENVINAVNCANELGIITIGLLGCDGGILAKICNFKFIVPSHITARIQEAHTLIGHIICGTVEQRLELVDF